MDVYYRDTKLETISLNTTQAVDESGSVVFMRKMKNVVLPCVMAVVIILVVLLLVRKIMIKDVKKDVNKEIVESRETYFFTYICLIIICIYK